MNLTLLIAKAIGAGIPFLAKSFALILSGERSEAEYSRLFCSRLYKTCLKKIKMSVSLPGGFGKAIIRPFSTDRSIINEIYINKVYEQKVGTKQDEKTIIVDVGAQIGLFTIKVAKLNPKSIIIAVEPEPNNFKLLMQNIKLNKLHNVLPVNCALGDKKDIVNLYLNNEDLGGHSLICRDSAAIKVLMITIDELIGKLNIEAKNVSLIKIDVEGAEYSVLLGAKKILSHGNPNLIIEVTENLDRVQNFLIQYGYKTCFVTKWVLNAYRRCKDI